MDSTTQCGWAFFTRTADGTEGSTVTITDTNASRPLSGFVLNISGGTFGYQGTISASGASPVAPSVTTQVDNSLLFTLGVDKNPSVNLTGPAGTTAVGRDNDASAPSLGLFVETVATAGATGTRTLTNGSQTQAFLFWIAPSTTYNLGTPLGTSFTYNTSTGANLVLDPSTLVGGPIQDGDLLLAFYSSTSSSLTTWTPPAGWTEVVDQNVSGASSIGVSYKVASSESGTYTFVNSLSSGNLEGFLYAIRGGTYDSVSSIAVNSNPLVVTGSAASNGSRAIAFATRRTANGSYPAPNGMSVIRRDQDGTSPSAVLAITDDWMWATQPYTFSIDVGSSVGGPSMVVVFIKNTDVTLALTGSSATASPGTVVAAPTLALTSPASTASPGNLSAVLAAAMTSSAMAASPGTLFPANTVTLTGVPSTASPGILTPDSTLRIQLSGVQAVMSPGSVAPGLTVGLSGGSGAAQVGSLGQTRTVTITGLAQTMQAGSVTPGTFVIYNSGGILLVFG